MYEREEILSIGQNYPPPHSQNIIKEIYPKFIVLESKELSL